MTPSAALHDLAQVRRDAEEGAAVRRQPRADAQHDIRDRETRRLAAGGPGGDPHRLAEPHVRPGQDVRLAEPAAIEGGDDARRDVVDVGRPRSRCSPKTM